MLWATSAVGVDGEAASWHIMDLGLEFPPLSYAVSPQLKLCFAFLRNHLTTFVLLETHQGQLTPFPNFMRKQAKYWWQRGGVIQLEEKLLFYAIMKEIKKGSTSELWECTGSCFPFPVPLPRVGTYYLAQIWWHQRVSLHGTALPHVRQAKENYLTTGSGGSFWPFSQGLPLFFGYAQLQSPLRVLVTQQKCHRGPWRVCFSEAGGPFQLVKCFSPLSDGNQQRLSGWVSWSDPWGMLHRDSAGSWGRLAATPSSSVPPSDVWAGPKHFSQAQLLGKLHCCPFPHYFLLTFPSF